MKVALVHDWLTGMRGGEYVLEAIADLFQKRPSLYTLLYVPGKISPTLTTLPRKTSWLQKIPAAEKRYRSFLPLMPAMIQSFDLRGYDLILSSSHCVAKGILKPESAFHLSYVHAPMRYMWDRFPDYFGKGRAAFPIRAAAHLLREKMRKWDVSVSSKERVNAFIANSHYIQGQIKTFYQRDAHVVHPFADQSRFTQPRRPGKSYLMVGAFAPNKRVDLAIDAFNRLKLPLFIVGSGQEESRLKKMAGPTVDFLGPLSNKSIADLLSKCRAFIFPGLEDFGITIVEALSAGAPVIAYGRGGAAEIVTPKTGLFFDPQTVDALMESVMKFEQGECQFLEEDCRLRALDFTREKFQKEFRAVLEKEWVDSGRDLGVLRTEFS